MMKYLAVARTTTMASLIYDRDLLVRSVFMVVVMVVFVQLWSATYAGNGLNAINGFGVGDLIWYMVITEALILSAPRIVQTIDGEVRGGDVAYRLTRPYSYPLYHVASFWGETLVRLPVNLLAGGAVALLAVGPPALSWQIVLGTGLAAACSITLMGTVAVLIGLSAFWVEDTLPIDWIYNKFVFTLGGMFIPLDLFPSWLAVVSRVLPFSSICYAPARLFVGFSWEAFGSLIATQVVWLTVAGLVVQLVFSRAVRRVVAHGG
ncbi:MAG TPA: ABC transporter permease [Chloroflexota bacterium]|nr:ABC transporter permease [Chloroflexota bacterium]